MEDSENVVELLQFITQASANADLLRKLSQGHGPGEPAELVRSAGAVAEEGVESVAAALVAAGYANTATLVELDAAELRKLLKGQVKELKPPVVRSTMVSPTVLGYAQVREGIADASVLLSEGRASRRGSQRGMASESARRSRVVGGPLLHFQLTGERERLTGLEQSHWGKAPGSLNFPYKFRKISGKLFHGRASV